MFLLFSCVVPTPNWYSLCHPSMCPYFRTAVFHLFSKKKLIPDDEGDTQPNIAQGFVNFQSFFQESFDVHLIEFNKLTKNISRFDKKNKQWGRNNSADKTQYYETFSPTEWSKLSELEKRKHSVICDECPKVHLELMSKFENKARCDSKERSKIPSYAVKEAKKRMSKGQRASLKNVLNETTKQLNESFSSTFNVSFEDCFKEHHKLVSKTTREERKKHIL